MLKFALLAILLVSWRISGVDCAMAIERRHPNAGPGSCISDTYSLNMKAGDALSIPGMCMEARCSQNGNIQYVSCGVVGVPPGCKAVTSNPNGPYPECCQVKIVCE